MVHSVSRSVVAESRASRRHARSLCCAVGLLLAAWATHADAKPRKIDDYHWDNVERVVAIGDLHGDYDQYIKVMTDAGLINSRGRWRGGRSHLVQTGDIPDRGPDTRAIIEHLAGLKKQAQRKGGMVHTLIGNHEAMNSYGDLRYVHTGEFQAFVGPKSAEYRARQWEYTLQRIQELKPEEFLLMDLEQYRLEWERQYPLGWVEHRSAWLPAGPYGQWVLANPVAVMVNDTIFLHGGLSAKYCRHSLRELTELAHAELQNYDPATYGVLDDPEGPLWYRGLALEDEQFLGPLVDIMLERYGAARIVVGHTPTGGVVWPRFDGRVILNDTGIAAYYGSHDAWLELTDGGAIAGYGVSRLALPTAPAAREAYLRKVIELDPDNDTLHRRLARMLAPPEPEPSPAPAADGAGGPADAAALTGPAEPAPEPFSPDTCR